MVDNPLVLKAESWNVAEVGAVLPFKALTRSFRVEPVKPLKLRRQVKSWT
jgi:hypothetical protein